ncbi:MAG: 4'-phosphopantetheinyl transferase superfamily protein [Steroidobacter sp.]
MPPLITVWRIPLTASDKMLAALQMQLSDEESCKAAQFKSDTHRRRYVVRHAAMRQILARETECAPDKLRFLQTSFGKPVLEHPFDNVQFNLSHSADMALLAVYRSGAVGVDIEELRPLADLDGLMTRACSPAEARLVTSSADAEQMFYRCWVGKEAVLKCLGVGLSVSTKTFGVLDAQGHLLTSPALALESPHAAVHLQLLDQLPRGFIGAVSILHNGESRTDIEVCMQDWAL